MAVQIGKCDLVLGVVPRLPLRGFPPGRVRVCLRADEIGKAFIKNGNSFRAFYIKEMDGFWVPAIEFGANLNEEDDPSLVSYAVMPGFVTASDGDRHFIGYARLIGLYKVNPALCFDGSRSENREGRRCEKIIWLHPREDGDYSI